MLRVSLKRLQKETRRDPVLSRVVKYTQQGWSSSVPDVLKLFFHRKLELTVEAECLLWRMRVVISAACQGDVLKELHTSHPGIVRMKSLARIHVWWPGVDKDIEDMVNCCEACQEIRHTPSTACYIHGLGLTNPGSVYTLISLGHLRAQCFLLWWIPIQNGWR